MILSRLRRQGAGTQFGHDIEAEWTVAATRRYAAMSSARTWIAA